MQRVFISYRRETGGLWALALFQRLTNRGIDAYYDIESGQALGQFDTRILNQIAARPFFLLVLTPGTLERCRDPGDWLWREIDHALGTDRIIVPMLTPGFAFADADRWLPAEAATRLRAFNGIELSQTWFGEAVERLVAALDEPVDVDVVAISAEDEARGRAAVERAAVAPTVTVGDLAAEEQRERAVPGPDDASPRPADGHRGRIVAAITAAVAAVAVVVLAVTLLAGGNGDDTADDTSSTAREVRRILPDNELAPGKSLVSPNRAHRFEMTPRGALVLLSDGMEVWNSDLAYNAVPGAIGWMGNDGNFVVYPDESRSRSTDLWDSQTNGNYGASLILSDDGVVFVELGEQQWPVPLPNESDGETEGPSESAITASTVATTSRTAPTTSSPPEVTTTTLTTSPLSG